VAAGATTWVLRLGFAPGTRYPVETTVDHEAPRAGVCGYCTGVDEPPPYDGPRYIYYT
jgi:hypothetical protein